MAAWLGQQSVHWLRSPPAPQPGSPVRRDLCTHPQCLPETRPAPHALTSRGRHRHAVQDTFLARASLSGSTTGLWSRDSSMSVSTAMSAPRNREKAEVTGWPAVLPHFKYPNMSHVPPPKTHTCLGHTQVGTNLLLLKNKQNMNWLVNSE